MKRAQHVTVEVSCRVSVLTSQLQDVSEGDQDLAASRTKKDWGGDFQQQNDFRAASRWQGS